MPLKVLGWPYNYTPRGHGACPPTKMWTYFHKAFRGQGQFFDCPIWGTPTAHRGDKMLVTVPWLTSRNKIPKFRRKSTVLPVTWILTYQKKLCACSIFPLSMPKASTGHQMAKNLWPKMWNPHSCQHDHGEKLQQSQYDVQVLHKIASQKSSLLWRRLITSVKCMRWHRPHDGPYLLQIHWSLLSAWLVSW